ncbi:MAG TPA: hypothetical protein ENO30_05370 [Thermodesulfobium narugense]|uniref:Uncharacterized protein n=1 Tax=Thermodesulfobium acidiphilum TaxID=1794699 RepID=A0A2R4W0Z8_THEAF|nr:CC/Se motif family (seleno)protein [Thermodesulfobium acidiphilum]AWB10445.1 hypothetical protein TDSAC_1097 [Thermodesulfobium acidiphilum]PMP86757.1 MAG: hypothetical protein C0174_00605 [Thermodesulfobium narugense]HEM56174.1 hypothetical protein [Thermodesulfobium narugense]
MAIHISADAKSYIAKNGNTIYFDDYPTIGTCVGDIKFPPSVKLGTPKDSSKFEVTKIDTVIIYLPKDIQYNRDLTIKLKKTLGKYQLVIDGWKYV